MERFIKRGSSSFEKRLKLPCWYFNNRLLRRNFISSSFWYNWQHSIFIKVPSPSHILKWTVKIERKYILVEKFIHWKYLVQQCNRTQKLLRIFKATKRSKWCKLFNKSCYSERRKNDESGLGDRSGYWHKWRVFYWNL